MCVFGSCLYLQKCTWTYKNIGKCIFLLTQGFELQPGVVMYNNTCIFQMYIETCIFEQTHKWALVRENKHGTNKCIFASRNALECQKIERSLRWEFPYTPRPREVTQDTRSLQCRVFAASCSLRTSIHLSFLSVRARTVASGATSAPADAQSKHSQHARSMTAAPRIRKQVLCTVPAPHQPAGPRARWASWPCAYWNLVQCMCRGPLQVSTGLPAGQVQGPAVPPRRGEAHSSLPWSIILKTRKHIFIFIFFKQSGQVRPRMD